MESASAAFDPAAVRSLATGTRFGRAALARLVLLLAALAALALFARPWRATAVLGLLATLSFAWTGHGAADDGPAGLLHLGADLAHLAAAAPVAWGAGAAGDPLDPLRPQSRTRRRRGGQSRPGALQRHRPAVVAVLVLSGLRPTAGSWSALPMSSTCPKAPMAGSCWPSSC